MKSQNQENLSIPKGTLLYRFNGVSVVVQPDFWPAPVMLTVLLAWVAGLGKPERSWLQRLCGHSTDSSILLGSVFGEQVID